MAPAEDGTADFNFGPDIHYETFEQILEMDDEDSDDPREFSKELVMGFLEQAQATFEKMDDSLQEKDLKVLSDLGHFLKGSSATLGFIHIRDACEKIQHLGKTRNETGDGDELPEDECLTKISDCLADARKSYKVVSDTMIRFYGE